MTQNRDTSNHIAVIGLAGRFPKAGDDPLEFWQHIRDGEEGVTRFSDKELRAAGVPEHIIERPDYVKAGSIIEHAFDFDADFFHMPPAEAEIADPQQRVLLQCAWETFERAGYDPANLDVPVGVFAGSNLSTYLLYNLMPRQGFTPEQSLPLALGNSRDYLATLLAYKLDLKGPALNVQTACSTSLVAIHLACQSLLAGETDLALAACASIRLPTVQGYYYQEGDIASPDGQTRSFSDDAAGTLFGSGAGAVLLKRLDEAVEDGDPIDAVIIGSALNNDGKEKTGFSAPSVDGQSAVISEAIEIAGIDPSSIGLVEAHGTATNIGDPIELTALKQAWEPYTEEKQFCAIGSAKSNMGHLETAAGMIGFIKAVMALRHRQLPPTIHVNQPTSKFAWQSSPFYLNTQLRPWPRAEEPRRAAVSSFGMGGTNAHLILEEPPEPTLPRELPEQGALLPLSARSAAALQQRVRDWLSFLDSHTASLYDLAFSAACRQAHHDHRLTVFAGSIDDLREQLRQFNHGGSAEGLFCGVRQPGPSPKTVFVFPGQGSQWIGMGRRLMETQPVFRETIEACDRAFSAFTDWSLREQLQADSETTLLKDHVDVIQPTLCALQIALAALWRHHGIEPHAVIGHSMGEVAAAHVAGALNLKDAARVICLRSKLVKRTSGQGLMALVELPAETVELDLQAYGRRATVAAYNGPTTTLVSAEPVVMESLLKQWRDRDVFCRQVKVDYASHCAQMDAILPELADVLSSLNPQQAEAKIFSTVTNAHLEGDEMDATYWSNNLRRPVRFMQAVEALLAEGHTAFVEISTHPIILNAVTDIAGKCEKEVHVSPTLERDKDDQATFFTHLGGLYTQGHPLNWETVFPREGHFVRLPTYPWQRRTYQIGGQGTGYDLQMEDFRATLGGANQHPLLGHTLTLAAMPGHQIWDREVQLDTPGFRHLPKRDKVTALDAPEWIGMALSAAIQALPRKTFALDRITNHGPATLSEGQPIKLQTHLNPEGVLHISVSEGEDPWRRCLSTKIQDHGESAKLPFPRDLPALTEEAHYRHMEQLGYHYPRSAQCLVNTQKDSTQFTAEIKGPGLHRLGSEQQIPIFVQAAFQALLALMPVADDDSPPIPVIYEVASTRFTPGKTPARVYARQRDERIDLYLLDDGDQTILALEGVVAGPITDDFQALLFDPNPCFYRIKWDEQALPTMNQTEHANILCFGGQSLANFLADQGHRVTTVSMGTGYRKDGSHYTLDPSSPRDYDQLFMDCDLAAYDHMVHAWNLDHNPEDYGYEDSELTRAFHLIQTLVRSSHQPRLWLLTAGSQPVDGETVPAQAPLWGLGKNIAHEHPEFRVSMVDLSPQLGDHNWRAFSQELGAQEHQLEIAYRHGRRYLSRLTQEVPATAKSSIRCEPGAIYLITGGLGEMGLRAASWLIDQGARGLALVGRKQPSQTAQESIAAFAEKGVKVHTFQTDVADETALRKTFDALATLKKPLQGIIHLAGTVDNELLVNLDADRVCAVTRPKIQGSWHLHEYSKHLPLDFFVMYSSCAALFGSHGQSSYAAGNQFMDSLAHYRRARGLPALSVNWGAWAGIGKAAKLEFGQMPIRYFKPEHGYRALGWLLATDEAQWGFVDGFKPSRWFGGAHVTSHYFFKDFVSDDNETGKDLSQSFTGGGGEAKLQTHLRQTIAAVLRRTPAEIALDAPLNTLGLTSLLGLRLRNMIAGSLDLSLPATLTFNYPTVRKLAMHLSEKLAGESAVDLPSEEPEKPTPAPHNLDSVSEEEAELLLLQKLQTYE